MKKIIILVALFISLTGTAYAGYELLKYREASNVTYLTNEIFDQNALTVVRFQDVISVNEKYTCYLLYRKSEQIDLSKNKELPNMTCVGK